MAALFRNSCDRWKFRHFPSVNGDSWMTKASMQYNTLVAVVGAPSYLDASDMWSSNSAGPQLSNPTTNGFRNYDVVSRTGHCIFHISSLPLWHVWYLYNMIIDRSVTRLMINGRIFACTLWINAWTVEKTESDLESDVPFNRTFTEKHISMFQKIVKNSSCICRKSKT
jgi:hypothetical protein